MTIDLKNSPFSLEEILELLLPLTKANYNFDYEFKTVTFTTHNREANDDILKFIQLYTIKQYQLNPSHPLLTIPAFNKILFERKKNLLDTLLTEPLTKKSKRTIHKLKMFIQSNEKYNI